MDLVGELVELYRKTSCELPEDVLTELKKHAGNRIIGTMLENLELARRESKPICQDTGTPIFYVRRSREHLEKELRSAIKKATGRATAEIPLRANSVCPVAGKNFGNVPLVHFEEWDRDFTQFDLHMKGGGSENIGRMYSLPDKKLDADRDLEGVRKCILDAVFRAHGKGCPPYFLGVCLGGSRDIVTYYSKKMLMRPLGGKNKNPEAAKMEERLIGELNELDIGPMGLGGAPTVLGVKIGITERHPASYFVDVSFSCWALRRGRLEWK